MLRNAKTQNRFLSEYFGNFQTFLYELFPFTFLVSCFFFFGVFFLISYIIKSDYTCVVMWQKHNEQLCGINIIHNTTKNRMLHDAKHISC